MSFRVSASHRVVSGAALLLVSGASLCAAETAARKKPGADVLVVADAAAIPDLLRPTPTNPIHYVIIGGIERRLGEPVVDVPVPDAAAVRAELIKALARQGFRPATPDGPAPQIAILFAWGTARLTWDETDPTRPTTDNAGGLKSYAPGESPGFSDDAAIFNRREIAQLLGIDKTDRRLLPWWDVDKLNGAYRSDRVYIEVTAFDVAAAAMKRRKLLWRTRISIDWRDHAPDALALMFASAGSYFGVAIDRPVFVDDALRRKAQVEIGEARVIESDSAAKTRAQPKEPPKNP